MLPLGPLSRNCLSSLFLILACAPLPFFPPVRLSLSLSISPVFSVRAPYLPKKKSCELASYAISNYWTKMMTFVKILSCKKIHYRSETCKIPEIKLCTTLYQQAWKAGCAFSFFFVPVAISKDLFAVHCREAWLLFFQLKRFWLIKYNYFQPNTLCVYKL